MTSGESASFSVLVVTGDPGKEETLGPRSVVVLHSDMCSVLGQIRF
jgi:hypothetical protein